jgi:hypothetical protein
MDLRAKYPDIPYETLLEIAKDSMSRAKETVSKSSTPSKGAENFEWTRHEGNVWPQSDRDTDTQEGHLTPNEAETRRLSQNVFSSQGAPRKNDERTYLSISNMDWQDSLAFHLQKSKTETRISNMNAHDIFMLQKKWEEYVKQRELQNYGSAHYKELIATIIASGRSGEWEMLLQDDPTRKSLHDIKSEKELWDCFYRARINLDLDKGYTSETSPYQSLVYLLTRYKLTTNYPESGGEVGSAKMSVTHCVPLKIILQDLLSYVKFIMRTHPHLYEEFLKTVLPTMNQRVTNFESRLGLLKTSNDLISSNFNNHHGLANNTALVVLHLLHREFNGRGQRMLMDSPYAIVRGAMTSVVRNAPEKGTLPLVMFLESVIAHLGEIKEKAKAFHDVQKYQMMFQEQRRQDNYVPDSHQRRGDSYGHNPRSTFQRGQTTISKPFGKQRTNTSLSHLSTHDDDPRYASLQHRDPGWAEASHGDDSHEYQEGESFNTANTSPDQDDTHVDQSFRTSEEGAQSLHALTRDQQYRNKCILPFREGGKCSDQHCTREHDFAFAKERNKELFDKAKARNEHFSGSVPPNKLYSLNSGDDAPGQAVTSTATISPFPDGEE